MVTWPAAAGLVSWRKAMKQLVWLLMLVLSFAANAGTTSVRGYFRSNGTYVAPHYRTTPNSSKLDNWSTRGNFNPYTGKEGSKDVNAPWVPVVPAAVSPLVQTTNQVANPAPIATQTRQVPAAATTESAHGDWYSGTTGDDRTYASTINQNGTRLLKVCVVTSQLCYWYLITATPCDEGRPQPVLLSVAGRGAAQQMQCDTTVRIGEQLMHRYVFLDPTTIDMLVQTGGTIGIASAIEDGMFKAHRFSLGGANAAIARMLQLTKQRALPGDSVL